MRERIRNILLEAKKPSIKIGGIKYDLQEISEMGDAEDISMKEVRAYLLKLKELWETGGEVYRIVFQTSKKKVDTRNPGSHWLAFRSSIEDNVGYLLGQPCVTEMGDDAKPFLIVGKIRPHVIDVNACIQQFVEYPEEVEIVEDRVKTVRVEEIEW